MAAPPGAIARVGLPDAAAREQKRVFVGVLTTIFPQPALSAGRGQLRRALAAQALESRTRRRDAARARRIDRGSS